MDKVAIWTNGNKRIGIINYGNNFYASLSTFNGVSQVVCGSKTCKNERAARSQAQKWMTADKSIGGKGEWTEE
jgi:hypothetical protein